MMRAFSYRGSFPAFDLGAPVGGRMAHGREVPLEVDGDDGVELLLAGVGEHPVADDAGVVDQHVESAERVDRGLDQPLGLRPVGDVGPAGHGFASGSGDLVDHALCRAAATRGRTVQPDTDVIDHHSRALGGERQRMSAPDAATSTRHDDHAAVEQSHISYLPY